MVRAAMCVHRYNMTKMQIYIESYQTRFSIKELNLYIRLK